MNATTEDLLRQALRRQADRAVDPERVRAGLPARAARRSRRRYGSLAGGLVGAAALAAVAVPVLSLDDAGTRGGPPTIGVPPAASPSASSTPPAGAVRVGLKYGPTWLPSGLRERARQVPMGPGTVYDGPVRIWKEASAPGGTDTGGSRLEFGALALKDGRNQFGDEGTVVDINGRSGRLVGDVKEKAYLHWLIDPQTVIFIHDVGLGLSHDDLLRVARSVRPDTGSVPIPVRLGWLPTGMTPFSAEIAGDSPENWRLEISAFTQLPVQQPTGRNKEGTDSGERWVYARLGRTTDAPDGGESTTVGGRPARVVVKPAPVAEPMEHIYVVVPLDSGLILTVFTLMPDMSRADVLAVAGGVEVGPLPDLSWLGA